MDKVYRNIYFYGSSMTVGKGSQTVYYSGMIFNNARFIKDFNKQYDASKDLYIICKDCAAKKYGRFVKVHK